MNSNNMSNNKRVRSSSPDSCREEYINSISDDSSEDSTYEKENELEENIDIEVEQTSEVNISLAKLSLTFLFLNLKMFYI